MQSERQVDSTVVRSNNSGAGSSPSGSGSPPGRIFGRAWLILLAVMIVIDILFYSADLKSGQGSAAKVATLSYSTFVS